MQFKNAHLLLKFVFMAHADEKGSDAIFFESGGGSFGQVVWAKFGSGDSRRVWVPYSGNNSDSYSTWAAAFVVGSKDAG